MSGQYRVHFLHVNKKLTRKYRALNTKMVHGIFQAQQIMEQLQRSITEPTKLSVVIDNGEQEIILEDVVVDPTRNTVQLLDMLQEEISTLESNRLEGEKLYQEINRQFNEERKALPEMEPRQKRTYSKKSRGFSFFR